LEEKRAGKAEKESGTKRIWILRVMVCQRRKKEGKMVTPRGLKKRSGIAALCSAGPRNRRGAENSCVGNARRIKGGIRHRKIIRDNLLS